MGSYLIPAEPGWVAVTASGLDDYASEGDPDDADWTVEFGNLETETLPVVAWATDTGLPVVVRNAYGRMRPGDRFVERLSLDEVGASEYGSGLLVGLFHPTHRPGPEDLEAHALKLAEGTVRREQRLEAWRERRAAKS